MRAVIDVDFGPKSMDRKAITDGLVAGAVAAVLSGLPSTLWALVHGADWLAAAQAAGNLLLPASASRKALLFAGALAHSAISLGWGIVLAGTLPRRHTVLSGAAAGRGDSRARSRFDRTIFSLIAALDFGPQLADHVAFGAVAALVVARRRSARS